MKRPELMVPAGSLEVLKVAIHYGADAVYIGGEAFGLRAKAKNFTDDEMREAIRYAHERGKKVYVTVNIFAHETDLEPLEDYLKRLGDLGPDALIIADPGVFALARKICGKIPVHISTQANNTNSETLKFWHGMGASRVVTARELSLEELRMVRENIPEDLEIETFIHGAMCISYSGRCLLSNYMTGRDANRGECTHPCRWNYALVEEKRPGEYLPIEEDERGTHIMNAKDLCMIEHIPELMSCGIDSYKIEGRMKNALYVATVARTYRRAIEDFFEGEETYRANLPWYRKQIAACVNRGFSTGFFFGKPTEEAMVYDSNTYNRDYTYLGYIEEIDGSLAMIHQKNKFCVGDEIEILHKDGTSSFVRVQTLLDDERSAIDSAPHAGQQIWIDLAGADFEPLDVIRMGESQD